MAYVRDRLCWVLQPTTGEALYVAHVRRVEGALFEVSGPFTRRDLEEARFMALIGVPPLAVSIGRARAD